jgi:protein O-GlcNAc transferase
MPVEDPLVAAQANGAVSHAAKMARAAALLQGGRAAQAEALCAEVLREQPGHADALHLSGLLELQRGHQAAGIECLRKALESQPGHALVHCNLGNALRDARNSEAALASYRRALELQPNFAGACYGEGNALMDLNRMGEALKSFDRAIALQPHYAEAHNNRGNVQLALGQPSEAIESYRRAIEQRADFLPALGNLARVLVDLRRFEEAFECYDRLIALQPGDAQALYARGTLLRMHRRHSDALADFERALTLMPGSIDILYRRAEALRDLERYRQAAEAFAQVLQRAPDRDHALGNLIHARLQVCDWTDYEKDVERASRAVAEGKRVYFPAPFLSVSPSAEAQARCAQIFAASRAAVPAPLWHGERYLHEKIRVAYVSADFREHPVSMLLAGVLEHHDRRHFDIVGIALRPEQATPLGQRIKGAFDRFIDVTAQTDAQAAALLRSLEIDIAVDLMGSSGGGRPGIFALRPAPVQVSYLGYPGTSGAHDLDYLIADAVVIPPGEQSCYSESVVYLPDSYLPGDDARVTAADTPTRAQCGLPPAGFVFCCFNTHYKISPLVFDVWMRLLKVTPGSVLWLSSGLPDGAANLRSAAESRGVSPQRLVFAPRLDRPEEHLARHRLADLFLDTAPFNAHATASDALWAGVPVLTCRGGSFAGRVAASLLAAIGIPELVAESLHDYEARALELAAKPDDLAALRSRLAANRDTHALFDTTGYCRHLEAAYSVMRERSRRGERPAAFTIRRTTISP